MTPQPAPLGLSPTFGFGDRIGLATPGHVLAVKRTGAGITPIFAQQSIREMTRTARTPQQVMDDAMTGLRAAGYVGPHGADADHLKTPADVDSTAHAGFVFFTIDPSDKVDPLADTYSPDQLAARFRQIADQVSWIDSYRSQAVRLSTGATLSLSEHDCTTAAVKYGLAVNLAVSLAQHIASVMAKLGRDYEIELSIDETPNPTTLAEHYIIADQCLRRGVKLVSLAPRFVGDFEKAVDYKGDLAGFARSLADHAAVAASLGPYKLSLHSGSDKLSIYAAFARLTKGLFHVKTAGTSYLEALRTVARHDQALFRSIINFCRDRYQHDKATYHVSATLDSAPPADQSVDLRTLENLYLQTWPSVPAGAGFTAPGRQILHCTFGSVLTDPQFRSRLRDLIEHYRSTYDQLLAEHFTRHLQALQKGGHC